MQDKKEFVRKRIQRDLQELAREVEKKTLVGVNAAPYQDRLDELHANIVPLDGPYKGMMMHVVIKIPQTYPQSSPSGRMADRFPFTQAHHEHIHMERGQGVLCADYLSDFETYFRTIDGGQIKAGCGWTPAMTLSKLLVALQQFFAQTDLAIPSEAEIKSTRRQIDAYVCACGHTTKEPDPEVVTEEVFSSAQKQMQTSLSAAAKEDKKETKQRTLDQIRELVTCSFTQENVVDNKTTVFGYPIQAVLDYRNRIQSTLIPEPISYEIFAMETQSLPQKLDHYAQTQFRSASGKLYNQFLPVYVNEDHYKRSLQHIKNAISILSASTSSGDKKFDFQPMMVVRVIPNLMNQMVVAIMNCAAHESESIIMAYCHLMRLLIRLADSYPDINRHIRNKVQSFVQSKQERTKTAVPDLGEFIVMIGINAVLRPLTTSELVYTHAHPKLKDALMSEYFARQVLWMEKNSGMGSKVHSLSQKERLEQCFQANLVSNKLLVFNLLFAKQFLFEGVTKCLDTQYGLPPATAVEQFQQSIKRIKSINRYSVFLQAIEYDTHIKSAQDVIELLDQAKQLSEENGYTGNKNGRARN